jgi:hypothetical protein
MAKLLNLGASPHELLGQLVLCRDLDEVLAIGTPAQLVKTLFGPAAAKTLVEPFGDALVRGLARAKPTLSSIAFALASATLLDPARLVSVLGFEDEGFELLPLTDISHLEDDLTTTVGTYRDAGRRLALLTSLWNESLSWSRAQHAADAFVDQALALAAKQPSEVALTTIPSLSRRETNLMWLEWSVQKHLDAEAEMVRCVTQGRALLRTNSAKSPKAQPVNANKSMQRTVEYLRTFARLDAALRTTAVDGEPGQGVQIRSLVYELRQPAWRQHRRRVMQLCRLAAFPGIAEGIDADRAATWYEAGAVFSGLRSYVYIDVPEGHVQRRPASRPTIAAAAGDGARFVRLGATLPPKPKDWHSLVLQLVEPYYVHEALHISAPEWVATIHGNALPSTDLVVKAPRDMREVVEWANYMGNCIHSIYGDDVHDGSRVILGLFRGDTLIYNVGVDTARSEIWEINSRFNQENVEPGVEAAMRRLVRDVIGRTNRQIATSKSRPPTRKGLSGRTSRPPRTWTPQRVAAIRDYLRADHHEDSAWRQALEHVDRDSVIKQDASWVDAVVRLQRLDNDEITRRFDRAVINGHDVWPLLVEHPLTELLETHDRPEDLPTLRALIDGDERIKLRGTAPLFDDVAVAAAWDFGRAVSILRRRMADLIVTQPRDVAASLQADRTGRSRWVAALLWVAAIDQQSTHSHGIRTVVCEFPSPEIAAKAIAEYALFGGQLTVADIDPDWSTRRISHGLDLPRCPQIWLRRHR